jgi:hypothetical protein
MANAVEKPFELMIEPSHTRWEHVLTPQMHPVR